MYDVGNRYDDHIWWIFDDQYNDDDDGNILIVYWFAINCDWSIDPWIFFFPTFYTPPHTHTYKYFIDYSQMDQTKKLFAPNTCVARLFS